MLPLKHKTRKIKSAKKPVFRRLASYSFLLLLFFSFFVQQALVLSFTKEVSCIGNRCSSHHLCKTFAKCEDSELTRFNAVEMDLDEDFSSPPEKFQEVKTLREKTDEIENWSLIRTKYLQQLSNIGQQPFEPLFVLQHSWKLSYFFT